MKPLYFLLLVLAYGLYLIYSGMRTGKKLQNHKVHSIAFPDEELNILFRKAKVNGGKYYKLLIIIGFLVVFVTMINLINYITSENYRIVKLVDIVFIMVFACAINVMSFSDGDGFWLFSGAYGVNWIIYHYELQNFKKQSQWQQPRITGYPIEATKHNIGKYISMYKYYFISRVIYIISLVCFFVSMLVNLLLTLVCF